VAFNGELQHLPIVDIIQLLHATKKSGTLAVTGEKGECRLVFSEGLIVGANYLNGTVRIGRVLVRLKVVSPEDLDAALKAQDEAGGERKPLLATLMTMGKLSQEDAYRSLRKLVEMTVVELIGWDAGTFSLDTEPIFVTEIASYQPDMMVQEIFLDAQAVLMDALRVYDEVRHHGGSGELLYSPEELEIDQQPIAEPRSETITADVLGLDDVDSLETKIPQVFKALPSVPGDESNRRLVDKELAEAPEGVREAMTAFLARYGTGDPGPAVGPDGLAGGILMLSGDDLFNHAVTSMFRPDGLLVFSTESPEEIDLILDRWLRKGIVPLVVLEGREERASIRGLARTGYPEAHVVGLSSAEEPGEILAAYADGFNAVIPKPPRQGREKDVEGFISFLEVFEKYCRMFFREPMRQSLRRLRNCSRDILDLDNPPDISFTILKYAAALFGRAATFVVRKDELLAERSIGMNGGEETSGEVLKHRIPLAEDGFLDRVVGEGKVFFGECRDEGLKKHFFTHVGAPREDRILLLPLRNRNQTLALIYADFGDGDVSPVPTDVLEILASQAALAFENSIYKRNAGGGTGS
jgi:hypothetical protein